MMEESHSCKTKNHTILITYFYYIVISYRTTRLSYILYSTLVGSFNIISKWEEGIGSKCYIFIFLKPFLLFLSCKYRRFNFKILLPYTVLKQVFAFISNIEVYCIVSVCPAYIFKEFEIKCLRSLPQPPYISLASCKPCTVNTALLSCPDSNSLSVFCVAD